MIRHGQFFFLTTFDSEVDMKGQSMGCDLQCNWWYGW